jgi:chromosome segregation ATPase
MTALPDEASEVFRADPDGFVAARNDLAARLAADDRTDDAAAIKALRKPTVAVWALNQLHDRDAEGVTALLDAGAELRAAQQAALSSSKGGAERLRTATVTRRAAVARLVESASNALTESGRSADNQVGAIAGALEIASFETEAGRELAAGTMQRVPDAPGGFGEVFGLSAVADDGEEEAETTASSKGKAKARAKPSEPDRRELQADVARLRRDRDAAERTVRKARQTADGFARELDGMRERLAKVEAKHADAAAKASAGELDLKRAERELAKATARLEDAPR